MLMMVLISMVMMYIEYRNKGLSVLRENSEGVKVESKARAAAIEREAEALEGNPQLIQLRVAEKWDGTLPRFSGGDSIPLINIDGLDKPSR